jgi:ketosteroid isomerase-like protein
LLRHRKGDTSSTVSSENVDLIRQIYSWFAAGEAAKTFEVYDEDIEWDMRSAPWLTELGFGETRRGHDEVRNGLKKWFEAWETIEYRPDELIDAGDDVLAFVRVTARGRASGIEMTYEHPQLWTLRDGRVTRMRVFEDRAEALQAAGLSG